MTPVEIISLWPSDEELAADLSLKGASHVRTMRARERIPRAYWHDMAAAARRRHIKVSISDIRDAHAGIPKRRPSQSEHAHAGAL